VQSGNGPLLQIQDWLGAPIAWFLAAGGLHVNDFIATDYLSATQSNPITKWRADIYGNMWVDQMCQRAISGVPGNMLTWDDAVHENFQGARSLTTGRWGGVFGTANVLSVEKDHYQTPTQFRGALRIVNTNSSAGCSVSITGGTFAVPLSAFPALQSFTILIKATPISVGGTRTMSCWIGWFNASGTFLGNSANGATVTLVPGGYVTGKCTAAAPAGAAYGQPSFSFNTNPGEVVDVSGTGMWPYDPIEWNAPFVAQPAGSGLSGGTYKGDRASRTDDAGVAGHNTYVQTIQGSGAFLGAFPWEQRWVSLN
jgi:hypothetical protein